MIVKVQHVFNGEISEEEIAPIYKCHHVEDSKYYPTLKDVQFDESINMKSLSYPKKFVVWKVDDFNFNEITDKIITTLHSVKKFVEDENIAPKDYKFNVRDVETLRDKDNYEASLFRTVIQFEQ